MRPVPSLAEIHRAAGELSAAEVDLPPENSASPKSTFPPENLAPPKKTVPPENLASPKSRPSKMRSPAANGSKFTRQGIGDNPAERHY
jgi:hypothetical protein